MIRLWLIALVIIAVSSAHATTFTYVLQCTDTAAPTGNASATFIRVKPLNLSDAQCAQNTAATCAVRISVVGAMACQTTSGVIFPATAAYTFTTAGACPVELSTDQCQLLMGTAAVEALHYGFMVLLLIIGFGLGWYMFGPKRRSVIDIEG